MSAKTLQLEQAVSIPSSWRLVNLALGLSALLSFAGASGVFPLLVPSRWLLAPWFTLSSIATVSPLAVLAARIGINLWLPAAVFILLFWVVRLHRKVGAPKPKHASIALASAWVANIALTFVPLMVGTGEGASALMLVVGIFLAPVYMAFIIAAIVAAGAEFIAMIKYEESAETRFATALFSWAIIPPVLLLAPFLLAPSNPLERSAKDTDEFAALCKDVGVQLMQTPSAPVRSIAYDANPQKISSFPHWDRVEMDENGHVLRYGGFPMRNSAESSKQLDFEFTEYRTHFAPSGRATINPDAPYYHFPESNNHQPYYGVEALSADALAFLAVDKPDELSKAPARQGAISYKLTLTDRRSGAVLGVQTYVVDSVNKRACGANIDNTISRNAFIYDAINR